MCDSSGYSWLGSGAVSVYAYGKGLLSPSNKRRRLCGSSCIGCQEGPSNWSRSVASWEDASSDCDYVKVHGEFTTSSGAARGSITHAHVAGDPRATS